MGKIMAKPGYQVDYSFFLVVHAHSLPFYFFLRSVSTKVSVANS